jgi:uncharacterized membrane protein YbhN (UPF0104 family)
LLVVISFLVARLVISLVGSVDWGQVWAALGKLSLKQAPLFLLLLVLRQGLNAVPLELFVPKLGLWRGLQNDLTANLMGTIAPPPGDVVVRISMFKSWGISAVDGMPGVTLNTLVFYVIRFSVPVLGLIALTGVELASAHIWLALLSALVAVLMITGLVLVSRGERLARLIGKKTGEAVSRFREGVDSDAWADAVGNFRATMSTRLMGGLPLSLLSLAAMVIVDGCILLPALRLVGVNSSMLPILVVLGTFLVAYPLTALPLAGLGVLDAALIVAFTEVAGAAAEPEIVAALVVWRVVTLLGALLLGVGTLSWWRWELSSGRLHPVDAPAGA